MEYSAFLAGIKNKYNLSPENIVEVYPDEVYLAAKSETFSPLCLEIHNGLPSPVMNMFVTEQENGFRLYCAFLGTKYKKWIFVTLEISKMDARFESIARKIYSANLFEREIKEMFGIEAVGNPDGRRLRLHDEVWPEGYFPLRKNFIPPREEKGKGEYQFTKVEGKGIFEVPVGPVHAGIIGPGHFRFSVAGEPIVNLEIRLGFTHRGIEKLMEGKLPSEALKLSECVDGNSSTAHSWAFCQAVEKICGIEIPQRGLQIRAVALELERMYSHAADIGGIALDVGFSFPAALASIIKESIHLLNGQLTGSRFLKGLNVIGGVSIDLDSNKKNVILDSMEAILRDFRELKAILTSSGSFLDRVDTTGVLKKKPAEDFGVLGVAGRASGVAIDLRKDLPGPYDKVSFIKAGSEVGDVLARLNVRFQEFEDSANIIRELLGKMASVEIANRDFNLKAGFGLGSIEGWRGPVLYWVRLDEEGKIDRCKITDPSFHSWQGLSYAVLDNIIPDFPLCNKSFDLSYPGNDL